MADWNYNHYQGIDPNLLTAQVNAPNKSAAGINALRGSLFGGDPQNKSGGLGEIISQLVNSGQLKQIIQSMNAQQGQQGDAAPQVPFPQGQQQPQPQMPNPWNQSMAQSGGAGMKNNPFGGPLSMGGGQTKTINGINYVNINGQWYQQ